MVDILPRVHFRTLAIAAIDGRTLDDDAFLPARAAGGFPKLSQQRTSPLALKPNDGCKVAGYEHLSNIGFVRRFITELQATTSDPSERDRLESFRPTGGAASENKFNIKDLRRLRELGQWLMVRDLDDLFDRLFNWETWSIGDLKLVVDFTKTNNAQSGVANSFVTGNEYDKKERGNLGPYGGPDGWKDQRASMVDFADKMRHNADKLSALRDAQKSAHSPAAYKDLQDKKVNSAKADTKSFIAEDASVDNPAFELDLSHGDLSEYVRMSDNFDGRDWVKIPDGLTGDQLRHVKARIWHLVQDPRTHEIAHRAGETPERIALLREVYFRPKRRVDAVSTGLVIGWNDAWDNLTSGPRLVELIMSPAPGQRKEMLLQGADRRLRTISESRIDLPGKMFDARVSTIIAFFLIFGTLAVFSVWAFGEVHSGWVFLGALAGVVVFDQYIGKASNQESSGLFYKLLAGLLAMLFVVTAVAGLQREAITDVHRQQSENFERGVRGK